MDVAVNDGHMNSVLAWHAWQLGILALLVVWMGMAALCARSLCVVNSSEHSRIAMLRID